MTYLIKYVFQIKQDLNLSVFNMITGINEPETTKHISCKCKCKLDRANCNSNNGGITINVDVSVKSIIYVKKIMFGILLLVVVKWRIFLANIMDDSTIICDEVINSFDEQMNFNEKKAVCKTENFYILFAFFDNYYSTIDSC